MSDYEKQRLETDLQKFTARHFENLSCCRDLDQLRFYIAELCNKINEYERRFDFVPALAYGLLAQYNAVYTGIMHAQFRKAYC